MAWACLGRFAEALKKFSNIRHARVCGLSPCSVASQCDQISPAQKPHMQSSSNPFETLEWAMSEHGAAQTRCSSKAKSSKKLTTQISVKVDFFRPFGDLSGKD